MNSEKASLQAFVECYSFAAVISDGRAVGRGEGSFASHLPLLLDAERGERGTLRGHMARANPQWRDFQTGREILAIFAGPHAYVSSQWYEPSDRHVPTWNYAVVHVYGRPRLIEDVDVVLMLLDDMMDVYQPEGSPISIQPAAPAVQDLVRGIVAFEIDIFRWEGKFNLSQNRTPEDRERVLRGLRERGGPDDLAVVQLMEAASQKDEP